MDYFLDTEFNGYGGELISLALVREDGESLYIIYNMDDPLDLWVKENVIPILLQENATTRVFATNRQIGADAIAEFLRGDSNPHIIVDWPDDVKYFCQAIITGPGKMASIPRVTFSIIRVNSYPTDLPGAVQHNAWWDAMVLRHHLNYDNHK
jgi:hypothetical protein